MARMTLGAVVGFAVIALLGVMTPGLDTMLVLRNAVLGGRGRGIAALLGVTCGCLVWGTASVAGLTAMLTASHLAYQVVRILGAAYLLWLGGSALWKSLRRNRSGTREDAEVAASPSRWTAFRAGMLTNLLNLKVGVFYMSLLPQFLPAGAPVRGALLVAIHVACGLVWLGGLVWVAARARRLLTRDAVRRWLDRVTATVLIGLGVKLAVEGT
ncbi:LysE family translocator [Nocardia sp. BMG51109]|uniref:LysE family translocator n=1 Tax=Nocardia sp. BMG51109 TaxID=1056816 RepID=UPI0004B584BC|nr:LysE family translocator [Nocardia sp. BMG51109]